MAALKNAHKFIKSIMAQKNQKNNPLSALETKILNALANYENETKLITELEQQLQEARETAELNLNLAESMKAKKTKILTVSELLRDLGSEAAIAIELAGVQPPPDGEPNTSTTEEEATEQQQPEPTPIAASLPGATASEQIANVPPTSVKKPETPVETTSELLPATAELIDNCINVDGYSFKFDPKQPNNKLVKGEFYDEKEKPWHFAAITSTKPATIGLRPANLQHLTYTSNSDFPASWDAHLFVIEKALQQVLKRPELKIKFPNRIGEPEPVALNKSKPKTDALTIPYNDNGYVLLDWTKPEVKGTKKIAGYTVSFKEGKEFEIKAGRFYSAVLKIVGQGTTLHGIEAQAYFEQNASEFYLCIKDKDGQLYDDRKTKEMPKHLEDKRRAAIEFVTDNFPNVSSKWESEINYTTPAPVTDKQPANTAANDELVK